MLWGGRRKSARFRLFSACRFVEFDTSVNPCVNPLFRLIYIARYLFLSLQVFAF